MFPPGIGEVPQSLGTTSIKFIASVIRHWLHMLLPDIGEVPHRVQLAAAGLEEGSTLAPPLALEPLPLTGGSFMRLCQLSSSYSVPFFRHSANLFTRGLVCKHGLGFRLRGLWFKSVHLGFRV